MLRLVRHCINDASNNTARLARDRQDYQNLLYDRGGPENQYIVWDRGTNRYVERGTDPKKGGLPEWMPRPVTPLMRNKCNGIISQLNNANPAQVWSPATDDDEDLATAEVCNDALPVLLEEIDYPESLKGEINRTVVLTDKIAVLYYYDNDEKYGTEEQPAFQCPSCQQYYLLHELIEPEAPEPDAALDPLADPLAADPLAAEAPVEDVPGLCPHCDTPVVQAQDPMNGMALGMPLPIGKICTRQFNSFEFSLPSSARSHRTDKNPWWLGHTRYSWEDFQAQWPEHASLKESRESGTAMSQTQRHFADSVRKLAGPRAVQETQGGAGGRYEDGPVVYVCLHDPITTKDHQFPQGLMAYVVGDTVLQAGPLDFTDGKGRPFKNVATRTFIPSAGSQFGHPPADDLVPMQYQRNLLEALLMAILLHNAAPREYIPLSVTLLKQPTGAPGESVPYRSTVPGEHPITAPGLNPPEGLYKWIEQIDAKFDEISQLNAVLQGERPAGDPTLGEIEILKEQGQSAFSEPYLELIRFEKQQARILLHIARATMWVERVRQIEGENGGWEARAFTQADLQGEVDVRVDPQSAWPKSLMMQRLSFEKAMELQLFQLLQVMPELATAALQLYGLGEFLPSTSVDLKQIRRELDRWKAATSPQEITPPDPLVMNLPLHLQHKLAFLKTEEAEQLQAANPPLYMAMRQHVELIQMTLQQQALQAAAAQAAAQGKGPKEEKQDDEGDGGASVQAAIDSGAIVPADAGGSSVDAAVQSGALVPAEVAAAAQQATGPSVDQLMAQGVLTPAPPEMPGVSA